MGKNFKFQAQDSFLEYFFLEIGRFEKLIALSEKKITFSRYVEQKGTNSYGDFFNILHRRTNCADMLFDKCFMWTKIPSSEYKKAVVEDFY